jgi:hypothetical protein
MKSAILSLLAMAALTAATDLSTNHGTAIRHHRRHHARRSYDLASPLPKRAVNSAKKCKSTSSGSKKGATKKPTTQAPSKKPSSGGKKGSSAKSCPNGSLAVKGVCIGMLPDGGSDGGSKNTMAQLNQLVSPTNSRHATFGQYAQAHSGTLFDGGQLMQVMDDLKESGAIFQPAVMPIGGWQGLTADDDSQAQAICNVMKKFTDEGIEVWLRFAHEVNWYQTDGTYQGDVNDFKAGWSAVANACKSIAPEVKMFFTPNMADIATFKSYYPDDKDSVHIIGIDFYPKDNDNLDGVFLSAAKEFHDEYCSEDGPIFAMGETGLASGGNAQQKINWLKSMVDAKSEMPHLHSISWFNYIKTENGMSNIPFKIADPDDSETTAAYLSYIQSA